MEDKALISVIMPAYNAESYIADAINSVIHQTYNNWELIIINDGSNDKTEEIVKEASLKDKRIIYIYQKNGRQGKARNLGISKSKGIYLAFLDADDIWLPEKLDVQILEIQKRNADLVFADSYFFNDNEVSDISKKMNIPTSVFYDKTSLKLFLKENRIPILTVLVKKEKVINVGGFSEILDIQNVEDYHLWLKLLMSNCVFYSSDHILAKYRVHESSATSADKLALNKIPNAFFDLLQLFPNYKKDIEEELKLRFKLIYKRNLFTKSEMAIWIKRNTKYLSKSKISFIYLLLNLMLPTKITKRSLIYLLNV
ncbi:glycosyltransferase family 2 protein [Flavobacterium sp. SH_e]|uniref:UDP-Glc:alpha-D-GlcNAc-diphosphoundecaprenol beta-1,3-glucosyltransferase WfgD n=1 Tax=Flavobacterium anhuiense TaxID=459526 RepID=A0AAC9CZV0_9FLAO|nr:MULTISPECIES: glycosyltransferase family 2 protein [Flavobacterium]AOC95311.1 UDP-Glc:alpha-D-GlcNAc-diphosphoundecaprenol beta-1,3-glucosyltransferase WfgD [Flavobacterium anhuiense]MCV2484006.1 glycosyltransferase family 2 protein [Flavobacterium sp. SH_e]